MSLKVKYCCGCLPLRNGLLIWGYFCLIIIYLSALVSLYGIQDVMYKPQTIEPNDSNGSNYFFFLFVCLVGILLHFIFNIVLVAGLHTKSSCMLAVYDGFLIISMVLEGMVSGLNIPLAMVRLYVYRADYNKSIILLWWILYGAAILIAFIELSLKYYILICVRSLISTLGSKQEEYHSEFTEVIALDNIKTRRRDVNLQVGGNEDFTRIVHDNTNNTEIADENSQPVVSSDVTVHDHTKYNMEKDDSTPVAPLDSTVYCNSDVSVYDDAKLNMQKDDNS